VGVEDLKAEGGGEGCKKILLGWIYKKQTVQDVYILSLLCCGWKVFWRWGVFGDATLFCIYTGEIRDTEYISFATEIENSQFEVRCEFGKKRTKGREGGGF
jgi:hypothetical protein